MAPDTISAQGLALDMKGRYTVGAQIGSGAFGAVYQVNEQKGQPTKWVLKAAPTEFAYTKKANAKKVQTEIGLINKEYLLYVGQLAGLKGKVIPDIPKPSDGLPQRGMLQKIVNGQVKDVFSYFVMEEMETSLVDGVMNYYTKAVPLGDIWKRLNDMTRTMHREGNRLFGDLKTDNVMFAKQGKRNNKGDVNLLRYVDLGHVTSYASVEKGDKAAQGTPLYWSIHNHNGVSQSRRDEYFANALMVAECGIRVHARNEGTAYKYKAKTPGQPDAYLPWATLKSDAAIRDSMKQVLDLGSEFYKRMPMQMRKPIHNVITYCHELDYKDNADLDELDAMIGNKLVIAVGGGSGQSGRQPATKKRRVAKVPPAAAAEAEPVSARAARAAKRQSAASFKSPPQQMVDLTYDSDDDQKPAAQPKKTTRAKRKGKAVDSDDDDDDDQKAKPKAKIVPFMGETAPKNAAKKSAAGKAPNKPKSDGPIIAPYMGTAAPKAASEKSAAGKAAGKSNIQIVPYMGENSSKYLAPQPTKRGTKGAPKAPAAAADRIPNGTPVPLTLNAVRRMRSTANDGDVEMEDCDNTAEAENVEPMDVDDEEVTNVRTMRPRRAKR